MSGSPNAHTSHCTHTQQHCAHTQQHYIKVPHPPCRPPTLTARTRCVPVLLNSLWCQTLRGFAVDVSGWVLGWSETQEQCRVQGPVSCGVMHIICWVAAVCKVSTSGPHTQHCGRRPPVFVRHHVLVFISMLFGDVSVIYSIPGFRARHIHYTPNPPWVSRERRTSRRPTMEPEHRVQEANTGAELLSLAWWWWTHVKHLSSVKLPSALDACDVVTCAPACQNAANCCDTQTAREQQLQAPAPPHPHPHPLRSSF